MQMQNAKLETGPHPLIAGFAFLILHFALVGVERAHVTP